ncbi:MAG: hypothetical protein WC516_08085 [Patescibacteria group bacterium]|jgi:hypothetical protein
MRIRPHQPFVWDKTDTQRQRRYKILASKGGYDGSARFCRYLMYKSKDPKIQKTARADYQYFEGKCRIGKR